jgi:Putative type VII ESX secretion system translocon, EccE
MSEERARYRFGPLERRGLLGQLRAGQAGAVAGGGLAAILVLDRDPTASGAFLAGVGLVSSVLVAFAPVGRRTAHEWIPIAFAFGIRLVLRRLRFRSNAPASGTRTTPDHPPSRRRVITEPAPDMPAPVRDVRILAAPYRDGAMGLLYERRRHRLTSVLACRVVAFSLLDAEAQERRLARWGLILSGAAGGPIRRIQWVERTAPAQGDELARWLHDERDPAVPLRGTPMIESYLELIGATTQAAQEHEILIALQIDPRRVDTGRGREAAITALIEQTERVAEGLEAAGVTVIGALRSGQLARALRTAFDPYARAELAVLDTADPARDGLAEANAWPLGAREAWDHYRSDGTLHATFWIGAWPRVDVSAMFMDALLGRSSVVRTVAVAFHPVDPERSTREVEAAVTRDRADRELRHRFGQAETARQRQAVDATARREAELATGHGEVRFAGFVTVSGRDHDDLRRACSEVHEQAARARLELHRMYGQQADAFTFTLPLCRGLR